MPATDAVPALVAAVVAVVVVAVVAVVAEPALAVSTATPLVVLPLLVLAAGGDGVVSGALALRAGVEEAARVLVLAAAGHTGRHTASLSAPTLSAPTTRSPRPTAGRPHTARRVPVSLAAGSPFACRSVGCESQEGGGEAYCRRFALCRAHLIADSLHTSADAAPQRFCQKARA